MNIILNELPPVCTPENVAAIDIEVYGMRDWKIHRTNEGKFASLQISLDGENSYVITDERKVDQAIQNILPALWVAHNASFDFRHLHRWAKFEPHLYCHDTLIFEKILWGGYYDSFGLKDLSRRYLHVLIDKEVRDQFVSASDMTQKMIEYAALDPCLTWKIYQKQTELATKENWYVWNKIDCPAMWALMDFQPFRLDIPAWLAIADRYKITVDECLEEFDFNPNSPKQVLEKLHASGLKRLTSTGAEILVAHTDNPMVQRILTYREAAKRSSTYGRDFVEKHCEGDFLYPEIIPTQAETGRTASRDPNLSNIPHDKETRACFIPSEGNCLVIADYNAQEPRITAWESGDEGLKSATMTKGLSIHAAVGRKLFQDDTITKKDPRYPKAKELNLGLTYGMTPNGLKDKINEYYPDPKDHITEEDADRLVALYFESFPGVKDWINSQRQFGQRHEFVQTASGRKIHLNLHSYQWKNNAINAPIQGGGSDISKLATGRIWRECREKGVRFPLVNSVYDELVADVPLDQADFYSNMIKTAMEEEAEKVYPGVKFEAEVACAKNWSEKP